MDAWLQAADPGPEPLVPDYQLGPVSAPRGRAESAMERQDVAELAEAVGMAEAARRLGVHRTTLLRWLRKVA